MGFSIPVRFGRGIDRASGASSADESDFSDLRNVALGEGKAGLRKGMVVRNTLSLLTSGAGTTDVLNITALRSVGVGAVISYNATNRKVSLWLASGDGLTILFVADLYTLSASAAFPRIIAEDSYGKLIIAHDEPSFAFRQNTKVYDPALATVSDLTADLNTVTPGAQPVKFRGVVRWLNYLVGWGYGTEDDGDRPEIVRISIAADPTNFLPNNYFVAGQRGDAVLRCARSAGGLLVHKETENYIVRGSDRASFGIWPLDEKFGILGSRLSVTVGGVNYRWSADGPRSSSGGPSDDLALPLDIGGTLPDPIADPTIGDYAFAEYLPQAREVVFCFGAWAYVLHLKNPNALRWSYRVFGVEPACLGALLDTGGSILGPTIWPIIGAVNGAYNTFDPHLLVSYASSGAVGAERVELWIRESTLATPWILAGERAALAADLFDLLGSGLGGGIVEAGKSYYTSLRFKLNSLASAPYASADASTWPAVSRAGPTLVHFVP